MLVGLVVVLTEESLQSLCGLPSVVVGHLGRDVVSNVGLGDTVEGDGADPSEELSVDSAESASGEGPLVGRVVGQEGVGVLKEGDQDEPVVNPEIAVRKQRRDATSGNSPKVRNEI